MMQKGKVTRLRKSDFLTMMSENPFNFFAPKIRHPNACLILILLHSEYKALNMDGAVNNNTFEVGTDVFILMGNGSN